MIKKIMAMLVVVVVTGCFLTTGLAMAQVDADKIAQALNEGKDIQAILEDVLNDPANAGQDPADLLAQASQAITTVTVQNAVAAGQDVNTAIADTASQIIESVAQVAAQTGIPDAVTVVNNVVNTVVDSAITALAMTSSAPDSGAIAETIRQGATEAANKGFEAAGSDIRVSDNGSGQGLEQTGGQESTAEATTVEDTTVEDTTTESTVATTTVLTTTSSSSSSSSSSSTTSETTASPAE